MPLSRPFDGFVEYAKRVSPTCLVHLDRNRYSVPASFANRPVSLRVYPERIVVVAEGRISCASIATFQPAPTTEEHHNSLRLAALSRGYSTQAWSPALTARLFVELPPAFRALQRRMLKTPGGDREMVEILRLVAGHDEQAVLAAVELALEAGIPTKPIS